jgi:hypothetical protein
MKLLGPPRLLFSPTAVRRRQGQLGVRGLSALQELLFAQKLEGTAKTRKVPLGPGAPEDNVPRVPFHYIMFT